MRNKIILIIAVLLWFSACSQKDYKHMYTKQYSIFDKLDTNPKTLAKNNVKTIQNGENPMKRPSYDEYRQQ